MLLGGNGNVERFVRIMNRLPPELQYEVYFHLPRKYVPTELFQSRYFVPRWAKYNLQVITLTDDQVNCFHNRLKCESDHTLYLDCILNEEDKVRHHKLLIENNKYVICYRVAFNGMVICIDCVGKVPFGYQEKWYQRLLGKKRWVYAHGKSVIISQSDKRILCQGEFLNGVSCNPWACRLYRQKGRMTMTNLKYLIGM